MSREHKKKGPKVLFLDIETSPKVAYVWGLWKQNISTKQLVQDVYVLTWCAKWLGDDEVLYDALYLHPEYKKDPTDDRPILESMHALLEEADYVVAHNGDKFDIPVLNARFATHGMHPPSSYRSIDTLMIARKNFKFTSNRLDDLGDFLGEGRKVDTGGFELWRKVVLEGDRKYFEHMVDYCVQDVVLLENVYNRLKAWDPRHPALYIGGEKTACNTCGSHDVIKWGFYRTNTNTYQKYKCNSCGHNMRSRKAEKTTKKERDSILRSM